jgi:CheY-like chemotaxis protein
LAEAKGVRLSCDCEPRAGVVVGDPHRLQQVIWNLLSNAVKFTPAGGEIKVAVERLPAVARLTVSDTGRGISSDFLPYVFDRFRQADSSSTRQYAGLGLGLSIVRHIVEAHGGSVEAESAGEGRGATFTVDLPLASAAKLAADAQAEAAARPSGAHTARRPALMGLRVLLVDDDADTLQLLSVLLGRHGAEITAVTSAADALAVFERARPDVLVSDVAMPDVDGYELLRTIRAWPRERGGLVPALALTAYAGEADRQRALQVGFNAHMAKPVEPPELVAAIAALAGKTETAEQG